MKSKQLLSGTEKSHREVTRKPVHGLEKLELAALISAISVIVCFVCQAILPNAVWLVFTPVRKKNPSQRDMLL